MTLIKRQEGLVPSVWNDFIENSLFSHTTNGHAAKTIPAVNLSEDNENFYIELAAPGLTKESFNIQLTKNKLTISAEQAVSTETENKTKNFTRKEFGFSSFTRTFTLPQTADLDKIEGEYENGILQLIISKKEEAKENFERTITIK
jgi:HSP20 family protein